MTDYYNLTYTSPERVAAHGDGNLGQWESIPCPITTQHLDGYRRISPLYIEVRHNRRDESVIWGAAGLAVHERVLEGFERQGFTGYRSKQALVRFRDATESTEYREFVVTGWAGIASPESGVQLVCSCRACHYKAYSTITDFEKIIDWNQWTGEDFFIVWPMGKHRLCTERVAQWLLASKLKSFRLEKGFAELQRDSLVSQFGVATGRLSDDLPEDLAIKYGSPLGLE